MSKISGGVSAANKVETLRVKSVSETSFKFNFTLNCSSNFFQGHGPGGRGGKSGFNFHGGGSGKGKNQG